jgi:predicted nucleic acid-binding protein
VKHFVLDASVALGWVLDDPIPAYASEIRKELMRDKRAIVPSLWHLEIANGLAMAERRGDLRQDDVEDAIKELETIAASVLETETGTVATRRVLSIARSFQLTVYDAAYLELSRREGLPLATLDKALRAAAVKAGVALFK